MDNVVPLNKIKNTACGNDVASRFRIRPNQVDEVPYYELEYLPTWDIAIVESAHGVRSQISINGLLRAQDADTRGEALKAFQVNVRRAAVRKYGPQIRT